MNFLVLVEIAKRERLKAVRLTRENHRKLKRFCRKHPLRPSLFRAFNEILERALNGTK